MDFNIEYITQSDGEEQENEEEADDYGVKDVPIFVKSARGKLCLRLNDYTYRKVYATKNGTRWLCSTHKSCPAYLHTNNKNEITMSNENHTHKTQKRAHLEAKDDSSAVVLTSRKGKEILLYHQFTYRKQYCSARRIRWVCSTLKNCRACLYTNHDNFIISFYEDHNHVPPKYYLKPDNVLDAIREPVILETD